MKRYLITIGTFDGVHLGHRKLMHWASRQARRRGLGTRVVFFVVPPHFHFRPDRAVPLLTTSRERRAMIKSLGIERVEVLRFGPRWAEMSHTDFFEEYLLKRWRAGGIWVGRDFAFVQGRKGNLEYLRTACAERGLHFGVLPLLRVHDRKISSSRIRKLLIKGDVERAALMLGRLHAITGRVVRGSGIGRRMGVPTANIRVSPEILVPPGVFHVRISGGGLGGRAGTVPGLLGLRTSPRELLDGAPRSQRISLRSAARRPSGAGNRPGTGRSRSCPGAGLDAVCNVGTRPTVRRGTKPKLVTEVHVPDWEGDLYGKTLRVEFIRRLRGERRFPSLEALQRAIQRDIARCR